MRNTPFEAVLKLYALRIFREKSMLTWLVIGAFVSLVHLGVGKQNTAVTAMWVYPISISLWMGLWLLLKEQMSAPARYLQPHHALAHLVVFMGITAITVVVYPLIMFRVAEPNAVLALSLTQFALAGWWILSPWKIVRYLAGSICMSALMLWPAQVMSGSRWVDGLPLQVSYLLIAITLCSIAGTLWQATRLREVPDERPSGRHRSPMLDTWHQYRLKQTLYREVGCVRSAIRWVWLNPGVFIGMAMMTLFYSVGLILPSFYTNSLSPVPLLMMMLCLPAGMLLPQWYRQWRFFEGELLKPVERQVLIRQIAIAIGMQYVCLWFLMSLLGAVAAWWFNSLSPKVYSSYIFVSFCMTVVIYSFTLWVMQCTSRFKMGMGMAVTWITVSGLVPLTAGGDVIIAIKTSLLCAAVALLFGLHSLKGWGRIEVGMPLPVR